LVVWLNHPVTRHHGGRDVNFRGVGVEIKIGSKPRLQKNQLQSELQDCARCSAVLAYLQPEEEPKIADEVRNDARFLRAVTWNALIENVIRPLKGDNVADAFKRWIDLSSCLAPKLGQPVRFSDLRDQPSPGLERLLQSCSDIFWTRGRIDDFLDFVKWNEEFAPTRRDVSGMWASILSDVFGKAGRNLGDGATSNYNGFEWNVSGGKLCVACHRLVPRTPKKPDGREAAALGRPSVWLEHKTVDNVGKLDLRSIRQGVVLGETNDYVGVFWDLVGLKPEVLDVSKRHALVRQGVEEINRALGGRLFG
jgi:hypothetical protein